ncbi:unnamed protein product [Cercospora beticola]|nr:unnamed protein product [Cercospora beticola]
MNLLSIAAFLFFSILVSADPPLYQDKRSIELRDQNRCCVINENVGICGSECDKYPPL